MSDMTAAEAIRLFDANGRKMFYISMRKPVLAPEFDANNYNIAIGLLRPRQRDEDDDNTPLRSIKLVYPQRRPPGQSKLVPDPKIRSFQRDEWEVAAEAWQLREAPALWKAKYGEDLDLTQFDLCPCESLIACSSFHDGPTKLTAGEFKAVRDCANAGNDLSLDLFWLIVEGMGWRPGMIAQGGMPAGNDILSFLTWIAMHDPSGDPEGCLEIALDLLSRPIR